ncbi:MAG TPA: DUF4372 domain-containing protein [Opitutaceae bacterium]
MLCQLVELFPAYLVPKLARQHGVDTRSRTFSPWSHVVALLYAHGHFKLLQRSCQSYLPGLAP